LINREPAGRYILPVSAPSATALIPILTARRHDKSARIMQLHIRRELGRTKIGGPSRCILRSRGGKKDRTEKPNRNTETETKLTETEKFGHKFGQQFQLTEFSSVNSVFGLG
jgi:hypothetical protein